MSNAIKCECANCAQHIEFEPANAGSVVPCPNCGRDVKLNAEISTPLKPFVVSVAAKESDSITNKTGQAAYLATLRASSNYKVLRGCIEISFLLCATAIVLIGICTVLAARLEPMVPWIATASALAGCVIGFVLLIAARQAAFLLIDVADTLLRYHNQVLKD